MIATMNFQPATRKRASCDMARSDSANLIELPSRSSRSMYPLAKRGGTNPCNPLNPHFPPATLQSAGAPSPAPAFYYSTTAAVVCCTAKDLT